MSTSASGAAAFQAPPSDLKVLAPFLQRAHETKIADPALSYWCNYHAAQLGIPLLSSLQPSSKTFLIQLMDTLESQKKSLAGNDVVHGDDIVAKAYVENVALKVFAGADNEDRTGKANKGTARRFLVAANFIEVLSNFGPLENDMEEKLKYSKWKAADIAKALREGRKPTPGAANEAEEEVVDQANVEALTGTQEAAARLANLSATHPVEEQEYIDREMAKLTAAEGMNNVGDTSHDSNIAVTAISPDDDMLHPGATQMTRAQSSLSHDGGKPMESAAPDDTGLSDHGRSTGSPTNYSRPLSSMSLSPKLGESQSQSAFMQFSNSMSGTSSPNPRPLPLPPGSTGSGFQGSTRREGLPIPPGGQGSINPLLPPPPHLLSPGLPPSSATGTPSGFLPSRPSMPAPTYPSAPSPNIPSAPSLLPTTASTNLPSSLDAITIARVQKVTRWAISALDYDDIDTARKQLREALDICEGKTVVAGKK